MDDRRQSAARMRAALVPVAERPGMWGLQEDHRQVTAFIAGCEVSTPGLFEHLKPWSVRQIRGARDKYGWPYALAVLAAKRVAEQQGPSDVHAPLVRAFLGLVCEYLAELEVEGAGALIDNEYGAAREAYLAAHDVSAHTDGTDVFDPRWHEECWRWLQTYVPDLLYAPDPADPWATIQNP